MIALNSDNILFLSNVIDNLTGNPTSNATITAKVLDKNGTAVISGLAYSYVAGTQATYNATLTAAQTALLTLDAQYTLVSTASAPGAAEWRSTHTAEYLS